MKASKFYFLILVFVLVASLLPNQGNCFSAQTSREASRQTWELCRAVRAGEIEKVKALLDEGADVNGKDFEGDTPLHFAVMRNRTDVADFSLSNEPM